MWSFAEISVAFAEILARGLKIWTPIWSILAASMYVGATVID